MLKKLVGDTAIYGISSILGRTLNYLLVPLYTSVFLPGEYGIVTELYAYAAFLNILLTYGMETAFFRFASKDKNQLAHYFHLGQTSIIISTCFFGALLYLAADQVAFLLDYPSQTHLIEWLVLILCLDALVALPFAKLRLAGKAKTFAAFKLTNISVNMALNLLFLLAFPFLFYNGGPLEGTGLAAYYDPQLGVGYVFLSNLIANALYLVFFFKTWSGFTWKFNISQLKPVWHYAWPLLILGFAGVTNEMLSRSLLRFRLPEGFYEGLTNLAALGIFGAVYKLSIFMTLVVQAFKYAYEPFFFNQSQTADSRKVNSEVMNAFILFMCFGWLALVLVLPDLAPIFLRNPLYLQGLQAVPLLLGGGVFLGIFYSLSVWYKLTDNNWLGAMITAGGALLTLLLNWTLIPIFGYMGSAWATLLTYFLMAVVSYAIGQRHYFIPYKLSRAITYLSCTIGMVLCLNFVHFTTLLRYGVGVVFLFSLAFVAVWIEKPRGFSKFVR